MLKYVPILPLILSACSHTPAVPYPNHAAEHQQALQLAVDHAEHLQECRERFMMCGLETGGMTCSQQDDSREDCLVIGQEAWKEVQACMVKVHNQSYCTNVK